MKVLVNEDFKDLDFGEFPYDKFHTALGEYHYLKFEGNYGNWYDPIPLHRWRSLDGSWLITSSNGKRYLEQNRGDNTTSPFENVIPTLVHKEKLYAPYVIEYDIRLLEFNNTIKIKLDGSSKNFKITFCSFTEILSESIRYICGNGDKYISVIFSRFNSSVISISGKLK